MVLSIYDKVVKGLVRSTIRDKSDGKLFVMPAASQFSYDTGIELGEIESVNCSGVKVTAKRYANAEKPKVNLTIANTRGAQSLKLNKKPTTTSSLSTFITQSDYIVPADGLMAAKTSGTVGFGVSANATTVLYYLDDDGITYNLATQDSDYASFDGTGSGNDLKFAVGANMAMKFGDGLYERPVAFRVPVTLTNVVQLGASSYTNLELYISVVSLDLSVTNYRWTDVSVDSTGSINFQEPQLELAFFAAGAPEVTFLEELNFC